MPDREINNVKGSTEPLKNDIKPPAEKPPESDPNIKEQESVSPPGFAQLLTPMSDSKEFAKYEAFKKEIGASQPFYIDIKREGIKVATYSKPPDSPVSKSKLREIEGLSIDRDKLPKNEKILIDVGFVLPSGKTTIEQGKFDYTRIIGGPPKNLACTAGIDSLTFTWEAPDPYVRYDGVILDDVYVRRYEVSVDNCAPWANVGMAQTYTFTNLTVGQSYMIAVRALVTEKEYSPSATLIVTVGAPTAPRDLRETALTENSVSVSWQTPLHGGGSPIKDYQVTSDDGETWLSAGNVYSYTFEGISRANSYLIAVRAVNEIGIAGPAAKIMVEAANPPGVPRIAPHMPPSYITPFYPDTTWFSSYVNRESWFLSFHAPTSDGGSAITHYEWVSNEERWWHPFDSMMPLIGGLPGGDFEPVFLFQVKRLRPDKYYEFAVRACNASGPGSELVFILDNQTCCFPPRELSVTPLDGTRVKLTWIDSPYNRRFGEIAQYRIYQTTSQTTKRFSYFVPVGVNTYTVTGLDRNTVYDFSIYPCDANKKDLGVAGYYSQDLGRYVYFAQENGCCSGISVGPW